VQRTPTTGVTEAGRTTATATDGTQVLVSDAGFAYSSLAYDISSTPVIDGTEANATVKLNLMGNHMSLDLSSFVAQHANIAEVDLTGTGTNTLKLSLHDVLCAPATTAGVHQLVLNGDATDTAVLDAAEWTSTGQVQAANGHTYAVYSATGGAAAHLLIDQQMLMAHVN
jgi:hypothetical protein